MEGLSFTQVACACALGRVIFIGGVFAIKTMLELLVAFLNYLFPDRAKQKEAREAFDKLSEKIKSGSLHINKEDGSIEQMDGWDDVPPEVLGAIADQFRMMKARREQDIEDHFYKKEEDNEK